MSHTDYTINGYQIWQLFLHWDIVPSQQMLAAIKYVVADYFDFKCKLIESVP